MHMQKYCVLKHFSNSLNFTEDREIGGGGVLHEGRGLETGHKSEQSLCFSLSPSSDAPFTRAHSLHPRPSNLSAEAARCIERKKDLSECLILTISEPSVTRLSQSVLSPSVWLETPMCWCSVTPLRSPVHRYYRE